MHPAIYDASQCSCRQALRNQLTQANFFPRGFFNVIPPQTSSQHPTLPNSLRSGGRWVRNIVNEHASELGIAPSDDSQAAGRWSLQSGAEYYAAGVGTGIAGFRAKYGLIDDPIRSRQDADSELIRDRIWDWYINDFRTRLVPGAAEVLIQTRWHEDDLAARALNHQQWEVISLPAIAEANDQLGRYLGEPLWDDDDYHYGEQLLELQKTTPARTWSALYQCRPSPDEGDYFKVDWLKPYDKAPSLNTLRVYGGSDYATTSDGGDFTVHCVVGLDPEGRMYLLDLWRKQAASDEWVEAFCDLVKEWRSNSMGGGNRADQVGRWSVHRSAAA